MKKTLLVVVLSCVVNLAAAEAIMTLPNKAGGKIVLTDRPCSGHPNQNMAYLTVPAANRTDGGCYVYDDATDSMLVIWDSSPDDVRTYSADSFTWTPYFRAKVEAEVRRKNGQ